MARETKVGLIVGLGVILFVGIFVSDYLSAPQHAEGVGTEDFANFHDRTTNQPQLVITREQREQAEPAGPGELAAVALENVEERFGPPAPRSAVTQETEQPPFRDGGLGPTANQLAAQSNAETPVAIGENRRPIDQVTIDTPDLAGSHQIQFQMQDERQGPGTEAAFDIARVELVAPETLTQNRAPAQIQHTVGSGETLTAIARQHYDGDGNLWRSIRDANPGKVGANGEVREGSVLVIPKRSAEPGNGSEAAQITPRAGGTADGRPRPRAVLVQVKEGQTLSAIALKHLGSANRWQELLDANADVLDKPENLRAGMRLRIPPQEEADLTEAANAALAGGDDPAPEADTVDEPAAPSERTYTVVAGDSLYRIAARQLGDGERFDDIYQANRDKLRDADDIKVGMVLRLPGS